MLLSRSDVSWSGADGEIRTTTPSILPQTVLDALLALSMCELHKAFPFLRVCQVVIASSVDVTP